MTQLSWVSGLVPRRIGDTPRIVAFRNILAHGYDTMDHEIVW